MSDSCQSKCGSFVSLDGVRGTDTLLHGFYVLLPAMVNNKKSQC